MFVIFKTESACRYNEHKRRSTDCNLHFFSRVLTAITGQRNVLICATFCLCIRLEYAYKFLFLVITLTFEELANRISFRSAEAL